jgi:hypothetical protein
MLEIERPGLAADHEAVQAQCELRAQHGSVQRRFQKCSCEVEIAAHRRAGARDAERDAHHLAVFLAVRQLLGRQVLAHPSVHDHTMMSVRRRECGAEEKRNAGGVHQARDQRFSRVGIDAGPKVRQVRGHDDQRDAQIAERRARREQRGHDAA